MEILHLLYIHYITFWFNSAFKWSVFITLCDQQVMCRFYELLQQKSLTPTPRSLVPPAPDPIGQALDVGRANTIVSRVAGEDYFGAIFIV